MGGTSEELQGPNFAEGVALDDLPEGEPLTGHFQDEAVLMVRFGKEVSVIGATCTHYGGPLGDGLAVDGTVRCPWHHACFSLRTGEAVGAPALNPLPRWKVEVRDGRAFPTAREEPDPLSPEGRRIETGGGRAPEAVVIVGAGAAGSAAAEMLRREGHEGKVFLVDPEDDAPYDRPNLSKDYLSGDAPEEWIPLRPDGFYEDHGIERIVAGVERIDAAERVAHLEGGRAIGFDALLLATGAQPIPLAVPGADADHVFLLRSLTDSRAIIRAAERARSAVVVGASFIGMEVASSLRERGLAVTVVAPEALPFEAVLGEPLGRMLLERHQKKGVEFRLGHTVSGIGEDAVILDDGSSVAADLVVVGIGVRPRTGLAEAAGLEVDDGVIVDAYLESSVPGIFAAGDIARLPDPRLARSIRVEHWVFAQRLGQAAARSIVGRRTPFADAPFFWTRQQGVSVASVGHGKGWDRIEVDGDPSRRNAAVRYFQGDDLLAIATVGRAMESLRAEAEMEAEARAEEE